MPIFRFRRKIVARKQFAQESFSTRSIIIEVNKNPSVQSVCFAEMQQNKLSNSSSSHSLVFPISSHIPNIFYQNIEKLKLRLGYVICQTGRKDLERRSSKTRSSWLNCALRDNEAVYWVSIGHYEAVAVGN